MAHVMLLSMHLSHTSTLIIMPPVLLAPLPGNRCGSSSRFHFGSPPGIFPGGSWRSFLHQVHLPGWTGSRSISPGMWHSSSGRQGCKAGLHKAFWEPKSLQWRNWECTSWFLLCRGELQLASGRAFSGAAPRFLPPWSLDELSSPSLKTCFIQEAFGMNWVGAPLLTDFIGSFWVFS